jgi:hypothetical protein
MILKSLAILAGYGHKISPRPSLLRLVLSLFVIFSGCSEEVQTTSSLLPRPSGLTIAGSDSELLFVANNAENTLQVIALGDNLGDFTVKESPAQYFPLKIKAGDRPSDLVASSDGSYIVVLNNPSRSLSLIDVEALTRLSAAELTFSAALGTPKAVVGSPEPCESPCLGFFYVSFPTSAQIGRVRLDNDTNPTLTLEATWTLGGTPTTMVVDPLGQWVFVVDAGSSEVVRVKVSDQQLTRWNIGAPGGAIALSADGTLLLVARPAYHDIVILSELEANEPQKVDTNASWLPPALCLDACNAVSSCAASESYFQHPANAAFCLGDSGLENQGSVYGEIYIGSVPTSIITMGTSQSAKHAMQAASCGDGGERKIFNEFAWVGGEGGFIYSLGLRDEAGLLVPELMDFKHCEQASVTSRSEIQASALLADCPQAPGRSHFECAGEHLVVMPGTTQSESLSFAWEGVLVDRPKGGGALNDAGAFVDAGVDFSTASILVGDIVEILSSPLNNAQCTQAAGTSPQACVFERRIQAIEGEGIEASLVLTEALPADCFEQGGGIAYKIRAGDVFRMQWGFQSPIRIAPGQRFGLGGEVGRDLPLIGELLDTLDPRSTETACQRYDSSTGLSAPLLRDPTTEIIFDVDDAFSAVRQGINPFNTESVTPIGSVVSLLIRGVLSDGTPLIFVAYDGSTADGVIAFVPTDLDDLYTDKTTFRLFQ